MLLKEEIAEKPLYKRLRKQLTERWRLTRQFVGSSLFAGRHDEAVRDIERFCLFIGYPRSGHSLVGALLDAHENLVIAHELNALRLAEQGFNRRQILYLILENTRAVARRGRITSGFHYMVPGQWQGRHGKITVVGDKKGGGTSRAMLRDPAIIERFQRLLGLELRTIHVVRNPFDNIATIARRRRHGGPVSAEDLEHARRFYFDRVGVIDRARAGGLLAIHDLRHEDLILSPQETLRRAAEHLGVAAPQDWLDACAGILYKEPNRSRAHVEWPAEVKAQVEDGIAATPFLAGYSFES